MKKKTLAVILAAMMAVSAMAGCGSKGAQNTPETVEEKVEENVEEKAEEVTEEAAEETEEAAEETAEEVAEEETSGSDSALEDGTYSAKFTTDSSMFHINEAYGDRGTLKVENGEMTIHITLPSQNIVNLFPGTAEDAQKDGAVLLEPTTDEVTYEDGTTEE